MNASFITKAGVFSLVLSISSAVFPANYDPDTLTLSAATLLAPEVLRGPHYRIADEVQVKGYMNHYTVNSDFGQFTVVGNRNLKKLLHEIEAIAELKGMSSTSVGADAAVGVATDTGKSLAALATDPVGTVSNIGSGVSRILKRTSKTTKDVSEQVGDSVSGSSDENTTPDEQSGETQDAEEPGMTSQVASAFLGIGKAQRRIAQQLQVDPYSDNAVLQAELKRVAEISGTVGKITKVVIPIPSLVGTAASVSNMVWTMSPTDLLIQNQETLGALGYSDELIEQFFANKVYSPSEQTVLVASVQALDKVKGREILLQNAARMETNIEGEFMTRAILFALLYQQQVEPVKEFTASPTGFVPVVISESGNGIVFAPLDHLLWTEGVAKAVGELAKLMDEHEGKNEHLLWVEGDTSELALANLKSSGWVETAAAFDKLVEITRE